MFIAAPGKSPTEVYYRLLPTPDGITLELWEPTVSSENPEAPYQFCLRCQFLSERDALVALEQYLRVNAVTAAIAVPQHHDGLDLDETLLLSTLG